MKLSAGLLLPLINARTPKNCDLSSTGIFDNVGYGLDRFVYNIDYRIKTSGKLYNKGKVKQAAAELLHQHRDSSQYRYTDAWVSCTDIEVETMYLIRCYNDGSFDLDGKKGNDITLPDCYDKTPTTQRERPTRRPKKEEENSVVAAVGGFTAAAEPNQPAYTTPASFRPVKPFKQLKEDKKVTKPKKPKKVKPVIGCNESELGPFGHMEYTLEEHGCKKGYANTPDGGRLEKKGNSCFRHCKGSDGSVKSRYPIACYCKKGMGCYYQIKVKKVGKIRWDTKDPNGQPYVTTHACVQNSAAKLPLPISNGAPEEARWENAGACDGLPMADSSFDWTCTNGVSAGSICTKTCNDGFMNSGNRYAHQCVCMENCVWNSHMGLFTRSFSATECVPAYCTIPHGDAPVEHRDTFGWIWPQRPLQCSASDGSSIDNGSTSSKYPIGATCTKDCPDYHRHPLSSMSVAGGIKSTCRCKQDHNSATTCDFDPAQLQECLPAVCYTNPQKLYAAGLDAAASRRWFNAPYQVDCDNVVPEDHMFAGQALYGSSCTITCAPGYRFEDRGINSFKLTCGVNDATFGWIIAGPYPRCVKTCDPLQTLSAKEQQMGIPEDAVIWACNDNDHIGSVCQKTCAEGYIMKGLKKIKNCYCKGSDCAGGLYWKGSTSNCVRHVMRTDQEVREAMDTFIADIFG